jgi:hypothetical protein
LSHCVPTFGDEIVINRSKDSFVSTYQQWQRARTETLAKEGLSGMPVASKAQAEEHVYESARGHHWH